jgi:polyhydroxyalkanoate synthesis regulator phasin
MQDALRTYLAMANGLTEVSRKRAKAAAKKLVKQSGQTMEQVQALTDDLLSTSRANRESLTTLIRYEVDRALGAVGLATVDEVETLTSRIHELEAELREARTGGTGDDAEASTRGARVAAAEARAEASATKKAAATTSPAKKVAKKAAAKTAPATEAGRGTGPAEKAATAPAKKTAAKKAPAKKAAAKEAPAKKAATTPPAGAGGTAEPGSAAESASTPAPNAAASKATASKATASTDTARTDAPKATPPAKKAASPQAIATKPAQREVQEQVAEVRARKVAKLPAGNPATATSESGGTEL